MKYTVRRFFDDYFEKNEGTFPTLQEAKALKSKLDKTDRCYVSYDIVEENEE